VPGYLYGAVEAARQGGDSLVVVCKQQGLQRLARSNEAAAARGPAGAPRTPVLSGRCAAAAAWRINEAA